MGWFTAGCTVGCRGGSRNDGSCAKSTKTVTCAVRRSRSRYVGLSVDRYVLPMMVDGTTIEQPLHAAAFAQAAVIIAP